MKSNFQEVLEDEIKQIIKEKLKEMEKLFSTVTLLKKHVNTESIMHYKKNVAIWNIWSNAMNSTVEELSRINYIPCKKNKISERILEKVSV